MQSMTGFATKTITLARDKDHKAHVTLSLKSLNSRYFEVNAKFPYIVTHLEIELTKLLKKSLHRGYVHFIIHVDNPSMLKGDVDFSMATVKKYALSLKKISQELNIQEPISLNMFAQLPNIFTTSEKTIDSQSAKLIIDTTKDLIKTLIAERIKEGKELQKDIQTRCANMQKGITSISQQSALLIQAQKDKINTLINELPGEEEEFADARKSSLYTMLDKMDIHEEIIRFDSHLKNMQATLKEKKEEKGKRLDFTLQELAREINTITAKCSDSKISSEAINIKVEIEKAREQAQNIV